MLNDEPVPTIPLEQWTADHMARVHEFRIGPDRELCVRLNALNMATGLVLALGTEWLNVAGQSERSAAVLRQADRFADWLRQPAPEQE